MGCDIHLVLERKYNDVWIGVDTFNSHTSAIDHNFSFPVAKVRNYDRFAALASVRGEGPLPKGIPDDISQTSKYLIDYWGKDGHSHSWLPLKEAVDIFIKTDHEKPKKDSFGEEYPSYHYFFVEKEDIDNHRLIFWFDN